MAFDNETFSRLAAKRILGLAHTGNQKDPGGEEFPSRFTLSAANIFAEAVPLTAGAVASRILDCTNATPSTATSRLTLSEDPSSSKANFVEVPASHDLLNYVNPLTGSNYQVGERVQFIIPKAFGETWRPVLYDDAGIEIPPLAGSDWFLDEAGGFVVSEDDLGLTTGTLACYVYVGLMVSGQFDAVGDLLTPGNAIGIAGNTINAAYLTTAGTGISIIDDKIDGIDASDTVKGVAKFTSTYLDAFTSAGTVTALPTPIVEGGLPGSGVGDLWVRDTGGTTVVEVAASTSGFVLTSNGAGVKPTWQAASWVSLTDTPGSYSSQAYKVPQVNAGETAIEFASIVGNSGCAVTSGANLYTFNLDFSNLTPDATPTTADDYLAYYDTVSGTHKTIQFDELDLSWFTGTLDHGTALTGLADDDHTQYHILDGRTVNSPGAAASDIYVIGTDNTGTAANTDAGWLYLLGGDTSGTDGGSESGSVLIQGGTGPGSSQDGYIILRGKVAFKDSADIQRGKFDPNDGAGVGAGLLLTMESGEDLTVQGAELKVDTLFHAKAGIAGASGTKLLQIADNASLAHYVIVTESGSAGNAEVDFAVQSDTASNGDLYLTALGTGSVKVDKLRKGLGGELSVLDADLVIRDDADETKGLAFQCSGITTSTTRTWTVPDADLDLGEVLKIPTIFPLLNGAAVETVDIAVVEDTGAVKLQLQQDGGGDLQFVFGSELYTLDCTPVKEVTLTAGTDTAPQINYVYCTESGGTVTLTKSTTGWPATAHAPVATVLVQTAASVAIDGAMKIHAWTDHVSSASENGHLAHLNKKLRSLQATWTSGCSPNDMVVSSPNAYLSTTAGVVFQLHDHTMPARDMQTSDPLYLVNDPTTAYKRITTLDDVTQDASGGAINNKYMNLVIWGAVNEDQTDCKLFCNLPTDTYVVEAEAQNDTDSTAVYTIPSEYVGVGFLIARYTVQAKDSGAWVQSQKVDLRGLAPSTSPGGGLIKTEFTDDEFRIQDDGDATKELAFQCSGIATGTTRTWTLGNRNMDWTSCGVANSGDTITINGTAEDHIIGYSGDGLVFEWASGQGELAVNESDVVIGSGTTLSFAGASSSTISNNSSDLRFGVAGVNELILDTNKLQFYQDGSFDPYINWATLDQLEFGLSSIGAQMTLKDNTLEFANGVTETALDWSTSGTIKMLVGGNEEVSVATNVLTFYQDGVKDPAINFATADELSFEVGAAGSEMVLSPNTLEFQNGAVATSLDWSTSGKLAIKAGSTDTMTVSLDLIEWDNNVSMDTSDASRVIWKLSGTTQWYWESDRMHFNNGASDTELDWSVNGVLTTTVGGVDILDVTADGIETDTVLCKQDAATATVGAGEIAFGGTALSPFKTAAKFDALPDGYDNNSTPSRWVEINIAGTMYVLAAWVAN